MGSEIPEAGTQERENWCYEHAITAAKRLGVMPSEWLGDWWISWSPRNSNQNAEGEWSEWVELAKLILARDEEMRS